MLSEVSGRGAQYPPLFLIAAEFINLYTVHHTETEGVKIGGNSLIISQLADETCLKK